MDDGRATRTYCYVADTVEIMMNILANSNDCLYNVGGESRTTIANLAKLIGSVMNVPVIIPEVKKSLQGAPGDVMLDITKIKKEFNKSYFVSLEEGLLNAISWHRKFYEY